MKGYIDRSSLCDRCGHGFVAQAPAGRRFVFCRSIGRRMPPDVEVCNAYQPVGGSGFWGNGFAGQAHVSEAQTIDPRPHPGQHV